MKISFFQAITIIVLGFNIGLFAQKDYSNYVNPIIGIKGFGHTFSGATLPFGSVQLSPDFEVLGNDRRSGYYYSGNLIVCFNHKHLSGTGCADYGNILFMSVTESFRTGAWQVYEQVDVDAAVDLGSVINVSQISTSFIQNTGFWIFPPYKVEFFVSDDGISFKKIYSEKNEISEKNSKDCVKNFIKNIKGVKARFVKVFAKNNGACPDRHFAAG